ncbi:MAG: cell division protein FtsQ/DivIB [Phascolarctobacterium sp.]|nr:cell division protein FtsQ/DivIB [Phascolarctobacterium sp.]
MGTTTRDNVNRRRRANRLRLLKIIVSLAIIIGVSVKSYNYVHQPGFAYGHCEIRGSNLLTEAEVIEMGGGQAPFNIFNLSVGKIKDTLAKDVRFQKTNVEYKFPADILITVVEREPALYVANSYHSYLCVDYEGKVVKVSTAIPDAKCPVLVGAKCGNAFIGDDVNNEPVTHVLTFLKNIEASTRDKIGEITMDDRGHVVLRMQGTFPFLMGEAVEIDKKVQLFTTVYNQIKGKNINAEYIDLTFAKPYIKLIPKS